LHLTEPSAFDHHSAEANADPVGYYRTLRERCPVGWTDAHEGFWYTTRYADVTRVARDDATFSAERETAGNRGIAFVIPYGAGLEQFPIELDPPRSAPYRELINPLLSSEAVAKLRPMIARHTTRVVDAFIEAGSVDFVRDLTNPLPATVTLDWLGFPVDDWRRLAGPVHDIFAAVPGTERSMRGVEGLIFLEERIRALLADRRVAPREDAVSDLVRATHPEGRPFTDEELTKVVYLLVAGGVDTTTSLTGSTLVWLSEHPGERQRLIDNPDLLEVATEEFLRVFAPSQSMARTLTRDAEVGGCPMKAGDRVLIPWVAANHDPEVFPDPETVRLDRDPKRHLSFGTGAHRCAGAHLARAMFGEMMHQVLTRLPDFRVLPDGLVPYPTRGNQTGWDAIPALFTPGARRGDGGPTVGTPASATPATIELTVTAVRPAAADVVAVTLERPDGRPLPAWTPGAHVEVRLPSGRLRQYSLCGDPSDTGWTIAVLREPGGRGGSVELHEAARPGARLTVRGPRNHFTLVDAPDYLLLAGGIGVTPLLAMAREIVARGTRLRMLYGGRTAASMAFADELVALGGDRVELLPQDVAGIPDLAAAVAATRPGTAIYCCGPTPMITAVEQACAVAGVADRLHVERFTAPADGPLFDRVDNAEFDVVLARTGTTLRVPADRRLIEVVRDCTPGLSYDCEQGYCGACETRVLGGEPEHRDTVLSEEERASGRTMMICVGRSRTSSLTLDL
jgi:cytochrome P450/ferredoxin-NADP reductase